MKKLNALVTVVVLGLLTAQVSVADRMSFQFTNPTFGGDAMNGSYLLNRATMQNDYKEPSITGQTTLERFEEMLVSSVLSAYARNVSEQIFDEDGNFVEGTITIGNFSIIAASDDLGGIQLTIFDATTGGETEIFLPAVSVEM